METLVANLLGKARRAVMNGRDYLVAPMTLIVPGVLPGSAGPLYYPAKVVAKNPAAWDGMPLVQYHPFENGLPVSARDPGVLTRQGLGVVFAGQYKDGKLAVNGWFDEERTEALDERLGESLRILPRLNSGVPIEVSSGLFPRSKELPSEAVFNGASYKHEVISYRPDHVAVLPDQRGACDIKAGCGVFNSTTGSISHYELAERLSALLCDRYAGSMKAMMAGEYDFKPYVIDVFDKYVVYVWDGRKYRQEYKTDLRTGAVSLEGREEEVRRVSSYKPVVNQASDPPDMSVSDKQPPQEGEIVNKTQLIDWLVANCECWKGEKDREVLNAMTDAKLTQLKAGAEKARRSEEVAEAARKGFEAGDVGYVFNEATQTWAGTKKTPPTPAPVTPASAQAPAATTPTNNEGPRLTAEEQEDLAFARTEKTRQKRLLAERIVANVSDPTQKAAKFKWLMEKPISELQQFAEMLPPEPVAMAPEALFDFGIGSAPAPAPVGNNKGKDESENDLLVPPVTNWAGSASERLVKHYAS